MDKQFAEQIVALNTQFYANQAESFSATRGGAWEGWNKLVECMQECGIPGGDYDFMDLEPFVGEEQARIMAWKLHMLDVACGNLRFEEYLKEQIPDVLLDCAALDNCEALLPAAQPEGVKFAAGDIVAQLNEGSALLPEGFDKVSLAVSFGFMHHLPLPEQRTALLNALLDSVARDGLVAVSFWRFADDEELAEKGKAATARALEQLGFDAANLAEGDYLLGWQDTPGAYRYCHSFTEAEVDEFVAQAAGKARVKARYRADGRTHNLNEYLILQKA